MQKIAELLESALTVEQLIAQLQELPPKAAVVFTSCYGDRRRTEQVFAVQEVEELAGSDEMMFETAYSETEVGLRMIEEEDYEHGTVDEREELPPVVVLRR